MAERVRDFLRAHKTDGVGEGLGLAKLEELLQRTILRYLRVVGRVAAKQNGELANEFPLPPSNATHAALVTAARATLEKATAEQDVLVTLGMSPQVVEDLTKALGEFERTLEATREGRREHVGASADLEAIGAAIAEQVQLLDGVVQYRFGDDAELMGAWASARHVLGPFNPKEQGPGEGGSQTPKAA